MGALSKAVFAVAILFGLAMPAARAQTPEKRIALVVGNAGYADHALPTTANDGGLIAQTLQAAGFDVSGARDLDAELLRRALRDFVQKVEASGPDTVAFLYLAGYGLQLAGENYFVPVDAAPARDTDVATETLRISDYVRQLQALPLKAGIVVLDAARETPFAKNGQPLAGGLALVEPDAHIFTAFNAAPGTVAPETGNSYSPYAQALGEMIRTGGLSLPELFDRVRLRVSDVTQGAQVPWDTRRIDADIVFFERAPDAPQAAAAPDRTKPIAAYDARDAYAAALQRDTLQDYDAFVAAYPQDPLASRVRAIIAARREAVTWRRSFLVNTPESYWSYLRRYPGGPHAADARRRLTMLAAAYDPPPTFEAIAYDVPPPPPEEVVYIERPYLVFNDPAFGFVPPPPPPVYFLPPPPPDFVVLAPPPPVIGLFILPRPRFVPIPVYVVPPIYVRPPPNNVIFANIHNATVVNRPVATPQGGGRLEAGGPALPPSVAQRAALIQQGKLAAPRGVVTRTAIGTPGGLPHGRSAQPLPGGGRAPSPQSVGRPAFNPAAGVVSRNPVPAARTTMPAPGSFAPGAAPRPGLVNRQGSVPVGGPHPPISPPVARVVQPQRPAIQFQRPAPVQAMARPALPPRMAGPPRMARPAAARRGPPPRH